MNESPANKTLVWLAAVSCLLYAGVLLLSSRFAAGTDPTRRPIVSVLLLLFAAFAVYLIGIAVAVRAAPNRRLVRTIVLASVAFRLMLLPSTPIQEVDIYRYLWDGVVLQEGINPFRYTPQQVRRADPRTEADPDLAHLSELARTQPAVGVILRRVHFGQLTTVYPPVSQCVFAAAARTTPDAADVAQRVVIMKLWLLVFDLATLVLVLWLLHMTARPLGWSIVYGWCPLLLKEVANSGHLDVIAVCLTTVAVCLVVRLMIRGSKCAFWSANGACLALALGVGAKLYPVVLFPLFLTPIVRHLRARAVIPVVVLAATTASVLMPMLLPTQRRELSERSANEQAAIADSSRGAAGLRAFLTRWEMNDFLFLILIENLKTADLRAGQTAWFSVVPESFREPLVTMVRRGYPTDRWGAAFLAARAATLAVFVLIAGWCVWRWVREPAVDRWLESAFLTLAWFWLLSPTLNPWYWTWVLPLLPFARGRPWLWVSGLVLMYYLRFWFVYHFPTKQVLGTPYTGVGFYDLIVTWVEFGPWFVCLFVLWFVRRRRISGDAVGVAQS